MPGDLVTLDLTRFTPSDIQKVEALADKIRIMRRWCRCELLAKDGREVFSLYSGDNSHHPYTSYRIVCLDNGMYELIDARDQNHIAHGRTIDEVIGALPDDFYFTRYLT